MERKLDNITSVSMVTLQSLLLMLNLSYIQLEGIVTLLNTALKVSKYGPEKAFHAVEIFYY